MSALARAVVLIALVPTLATAQGRPVVEIGTRLGVTVESAHGATLTHVGAPGSGIVGQPTIYASFFATPNMFVEPEIAFNVVTGLGQTATSIGGLLSLGYLSSWDARSAPFIAGTFGVERMSEGGYSHTEATVGGRIGVRLLASQAFAVRIEGGYRRWLGSSNENEITFGIGLGGVLRTAR